MIPIAVYGESQQADHIQYILAADVGGTKANLALYQVKATEMKRIHYTKFASQAHGSFIDIIDRFIKDLPVQPQKICIGVAGPVSNGEVMFTNLSWKVSEQEIIRHTGVEQVALINDLEATAYGLSCLPNEDLLTLHPGKKSAKSGNIALIAPGTGLGEAGMFFDGHCYHPFATEGGHSSFAPRTDTDWGLHQYLCRKEKVVSWEHVIAGPGIYQIYSYLREVEQLNAPDWLQQALQQGDRSATISHAALEKNTPICSRTMELYVQYLAYEAANLVLKLKASGGLYIGGGIPPKILPLLQDNCFYTAFLDCDRMQDLVKAVPIQVVLNDKAALLGAAYYGAYGIGG